MNKYFCSNNHCKFKYTHIWYNYIIIYNTFIYVFSMNTFSFQVFLCLEILNVYSIHYTDQSYHYQSTINYCLIILSTSPTIDFERTGLPMLRLATLRLVQWCAATGRTRPTTWGWVGTSANGSLPSPVLPTISWNRGSVYIGLQSTDGDGRRGK